MRVTDLEKFALEQIWRPYQSKAGYDHMKRLEKLPVSLLETAQALCHDSEWSRAVIDRLSAIGVTFPSYISHPLATIVTWRISKASPLPTPPEERT